VTDEDSLAKSSGNSNCGSARRSLRRRHTYVDSSPIRLAKRDGHARHDSHGRDFSDDWRVGDAGRDHVRRAWHKREPVADATTDDVLRGADDGRRGCHGGQVVLLLGRRQRSIAG